MKSKNLFIVFAYSCFLFFSCSNSENENAIEIKNETPEALEENKFKIDMSRGTDDIGEELYQELVSKDPVLEKLEVDFNDWELKSTSTLQKFKFYKSKSNIYYGLSKNKIDGIEDSLLKRKISMLFTKSYNQYENRTEEINALISQISKNSSSMKDRHEVLKLILTLPLIEKYQKEKLPDKKELKVLLIEQNKLNRKIDSLIPNY